MHVSQVSLCDSLMMSQLALEMVVRLFMEMSHLSHSIGPSLCGSHGDAPTCARDVREVRVQRRSFEVVMDLFGCKKNPFEHTPGIFSFGDFPGENLLKKGGVEGCALTALFRALEWVCMILVS